MTALPKNDSLKKALEVNKKIADLADLRTELVQDRATYLVRALNESGLNPREIGEHFGVNRQRIYQMVEQGGQRMPRLR